MLGGAAVTEEVFPGFKFSVCSYVVSLLRPEIIRELDLPRHGLGDPAARRHVHADAERRLPVARQRSRQDAPRDRAPLAARRRGLRRVRQGDGRDGRGSSSRSSTMTPPDPTSLDPARPDGPAVPRQALPALADQDKYNQIQLMTMSAVDFLDQWFETDVLKATMSASGIIGTFLGVRSPGTAYVLLHHYMGEIDGAFRSWGFARGGTGAISNAIAGAAREAGARSGPRRRSRRSSSRTARAVGVVLENGDELAADVVSSSVDPHLTFLKLVEPSICPASSSRTCGATSSAARRARSTSRSTRCRTSRACRAGRTCAARSRSRRASTTWSAPTTTPSTASSRAGPTSTS